tara:strand:+ start:2321 stop:2989 length:669 start_codon:yes stop_codon:yes gene_type:complete
MVRDFGGYLINLISSPIPLTKVGENKMSDNTEKDMSMSDNDWDSRIGKVQTWIKEHRPLIKADEDVSDSVDIIKMNIKRGGKRSAMRKKYWSSILLEGRNLEDWPIQKGKESTLPMNVQASLKEMGNAVAEAYTGFWNDNEIIQQISVVSDRNKELGGSSYEDAETFAKGRVLAVRQRFTKYFNDGRWTGDFDATAGFNISPPPAEEGAATTETGEDSPATV